LDLLELQRGKKKPLVECPSGMMDEWNRFEEFSIFSLKEIRFILSQIERISHAIRTKIPHRWDVAIKKIIKIIQ
jgi:hypothetical protein